MKVRKIGEVETGDVEEGCVILVDKPAGMSSFGVVARVRRRLGERLGRKVKVGHAGTLDPFATGLLVLLVGRGTKRAGEFLKLDKEYEAELRLGWTSTTGDPEGEIRRMESLEGGAECDGEVGDGEGGMGRDEWGGAECGSNGSGVVGREFGRGEILRVMEKFQGEIWQRVPRYSAVKIAGERAYRRARRGEEVEMPMRKVVISKMELVEMRGEMVKFRCAVSSGTYVRALGEEMGRELGVGGYLVGLRRVRVGEFEVGEAEGI